MHAAPSFPQKNYRTASLWELFCPCLMWDLDKLLHLAGLFFGTADPKSYPCVPTDVHFWYTATCTYNFAHLHTHQDLIQTHMVSLRLGAASRQHNSVLPTKLLLLHSAQIELMRKKRLPVCTWGDATPTLTNVTVSGNMARNWNSIICRFRC